MEEMGGYAFIAGVAIAILAGFVSGYETIVAPLLVVLGIVVGFMNVKDKEVSSFLLASVAVLAAGVGSLSGLTDVTAIAGIGTMVESILQNILAFVAPAAFVVGMKVIKDIGHKM